MKLRTLFIITYSITASRLDTSIEEGGISDENDDVEVKQHHWKEGKTFHFEVKLKVKGLTHEDTRNASPSALGDFCHLEECSNIPLDDRSSEDKFCGRTSWLYSSIDGPTFPNEYPWLGIMIDRDHSDACIVVLINSEWVITLAHCVARTSPEDILVYLGALGTMSSHHVARKIVHEDFDEHKKTADLALLKLSDNVNFTRETRPLCLPVYEVGKGRSAEVTGYANDVLQKVKVKISTDYTSDNDNPKVKGKFAQLSRNRLKGVESISSEVCYNEVHGSVLTEKRYYTHQMVGIFAFNSVKDTCVGTNSVAYFTNMFAYNDWMRKMIGCKNQLCV